MPEFIFEFTSHSLMYFGTMGCSCDNFLKPKYVPLIFFPLCMNNMCTLSVFNFDSYVSDVDRNGSLFVSSRST